MSPQLHRALVILGIGILLANCTPQSAKVNSSSTPDHGNWNMNTSPWPGEGIYSGVTFTLTTAQVCTGIQIFGETGVAICQSGTTTQAASAAEILATKEAWNSTGTKMTGTMINRGALDASTVFPGAGYYNGTVNNAPLALQIVSGHTILGIPGAYTGSFSASTASNALRDAGVSIISSLPTQSTSTQLSLESEGVTYSGADLPATGGYNYREIPDVTKDDDGHRGANCKYAPRPSNNCGTSQTTIAARISDCATQNPTASSWDGATQCNGGQGAWKLVARSAANKEVWQDQRTGLFWSSFVSTSVNWCQASGNTQLAPVTYYSAYNNSGGNAITGNGTIGNISGGSSSLYETITITFSNATTFTVSGSGGASGCESGSITAGGLTTTAGSTATWSATDVCSFTITQGSTNFAANDKFDLASVEASYSCAPGAGLQPASPTSFCAEVAGLNAPAGENWGAGTYMTAKGSMGKNSAPSVRWRLPTRADYELADINGIRMVMPDMGITGTSRPVIDGSVGNNSFEWTATLTAYDRIFAWIFSPYGSTDRYNRNSNYRARCVGR